MQQLIGRITQTAQVARLKDGREVTNFSLALNDRYKPKGSDEVKEVVTYIDCAYWLNTKLAQYLTKGTLVELIGRLGMKVYTSKDGETRGSITFHVQNVTLHGKGSTQPKEKEQEETDAKTDDLPF